MPNKPAVSARVDAACQKQSGSCLFSIQTPRLCIRDFQESDCAAVLKYASDPEVVRFLEWGPYAEEEQCLSDIRGAQLTTAATPRVNYGLAIVLNRDKSLIGTCGLNVIDPVFREGCLGYVLNRRFWGQGYATEAAQALIRFGFETLKLHRLVAYCHPENSPSIRVLEKLGLTCEGRLKSHRCKNGQWYDSLLYAIISNG